ncbi:restriction endonuclease subunit S [Rothia nasimurium]|uniref:restriction endonuclease subunit S n=1 Tax=Rothia nasimurium TaxID=85336 RepID=UPI001F00A765|nr:restriction endonuclease subunit S [Rothia nasimurium]
MSEKRTVRLGDVCQVTMGQAPKGDTYNTDGEGYPLIAGAGDFDNKGGISVSKFTTAPTRLSEPGDIIMSIRASIGATVWADKIYCLGRGVAGLRPGPELDSQFLWYWLPTVEKLLLSKARGATFVQVNRKDVEELPIELPPLDQQRKFAEEQHLKFLIQQKRERQQELFIEFERAIFNQKYAKATKSVKLGDIVEIRSGLVDPTLPEYQDLPHIGPDSIVSGRDEIRGWRTAAEDGVKSGKFLFKKGDILYSKIRPNLNKVAIAQFDGLCSADMYPLIVNNNLVGSKYLQMALSSERFIAYASSLSNRANIPKLNKKQLLSFQLKI